MLTNNQYITNRRRGSGYWLISLLLIVTIQDTVAAERVIPVYAELEEAANFVGPNRDLVPIGPGYELVLAVVATAGFEADIRVVPWPRVVHSLESQNNVIAFSMTRTPAREEHYHWIGRIQDVHFKLWALAERAADFPATLEEATEFRISAIRNDVVESYLKTKEFNNLIYFNESANTLTMLRRDRVDLMPYVESGMPAYLARKNESPDVLLPIYSLDEISTGQYIVMSKQSDQALVQRFKRAYEEVVESGAYQEIIAPFNAAIEP